MQTLNATELMPAAKAVEIVRSVSDACNGFDAATPDQQRALATELLQNATWRAGQFESAVVCPPPPVRAILE
jgi:hypothetical protein